MTAQDPEIIVDPLQPGDPGYVDPSERKDPPGQPAQPTGAGESSPGMLSGGTLVRVNRDDGTRLFFMEYEYPPGSGQKMLFQFDDLEQVKATLGDDFRENEDIGFRTQRNEDFLKRDLVNIVGEASELAGMEGRFRFFIEDLMYQTALEAGIRDPGLIGEYLSNPEIQLVLAQGALGDWSPERILGEVRNTEFYRNELYPGIDHFLGNGSANPEQEWKQYMTNVEGALDLLGYKKDSNGTYRTAVGDLLASGVSDDLFVQMAPTLYKAQNSGAFADVLNQWTTRNLGKELTFDDLFDIFEGTATGDLLTVVEAANVQFIAEQEGVDVSRRRIERIVGETDLAESQVQAAFNTVEQQMLALDNVLLEGRFGLTKGELIDAATGIAPKSGRSIQEVRNLARKAAVEEGLLDDQKLQLFVGFNPRTGTPFRPGLNPLSPESA